MNSEQAQWPGESVQSALRRTQDCKTDFILIYPRQRFCSTYLYRVFVFQIRIRELEDSLDTEREGRMRVSDLFPPS